MNEYSRDDNSPGTNVESLKQVLDAMPVPIVLLDRNEHPLYLSKEFESLCGYTLDDMPSAEDWWLLAHPDEKYREQVRCAWQKEMKRAVRENDKPRPQEWTITCKDGSQKQFEFSAAIVGSNYLVMMKDVSERKQQEARLLDSEARFKALAWASFEGVVVAHEGIIQDCNDQYVQISGYSREELIGKPIVDLIAPESSEIIAEAIKTELLEPYEHAMRRKNGELLRVEARGRSIQLGDDVLQVGVIRDVTERKEAEKTLRFAQFALENMADAAYWFLEDTSIIYANQAACDLVGYTKEEITRMSVRDVGPDISQSIYACLWENLLKRKQQQLDTTALTKDGHRIPVEVTASLLEFEGQEFCCAFARDITERKRVEEALRESSNMLKLVLDTIPARVFWKDRDGVYLGCNKMFAFDAGLASPEEAVGKTDYDMPWGAQVEFYRSDDRNVIETDVPKLYYEEPQDTPHGLAIVQTSKVPLRDPAGNIIGILGTYTDITERKRAEEDLALSNEELRAINRLIADTTRLADMKSVLEMAIDEALQIVGLEGGTICLLGSDGTFELAAHRATSEETIADIKTGSVRIGECLCGKSAETGEPLILATPEEVLSFATREALRKENIAFHAAFPLMVESKCLGVLCVFTRTDKKPAERRLKLIETATKQIALAIERARLFDEVKQSAEELEQRVLERTIQLENVNKELEAFSYSVSHDLRAPLRAIDGFSMVVLEDYSDALDESGKGYLGRIRAAAVKMGSLIDDILRLSRVSRAEMSISKVDLSGMARSILADLMETRPERKVELVIAPDLVANADSNLIKIALENMLGNAWKFTSKRDIARIEFGTVREKGKKIYYIRDNGVGFDQSHADKLFRAFQRLHSETEFSGTGVGLATVKRIICKHGGDIWAVGEVDKGVTFYFTLESRK